MAYDYTDYIYDPSTGRCVLTRKAVEGKFFPVADHVSLAELRALGKEITDVRYAFTGDIRAKATGEFRCPKKGEWYLSGAIVEAYKAPNDLNVKFQIAKLVRIKTIITEVEVSGRENISG